MQHIQQKEALQAKQMTPSYLSVTKIEKLMELVSNRNLNNVSVPLFEGYGFSKSDAILAVSTLKFLGVVNDQGQATDNMTKLRLTGEARKQAFEKILRSSHYKRLFDATDSPQDLSSDELVNEVIVQYGNISQRLAKAAVAVFFKFCELAGLKSEKSASARKHSIKSDIKTKIRKTANSVAQNKSSLVNNNPDLAPVFIAENRMILYMPSKLKDRLLDDETIEEDWRKVRNSIREFAVKYVPKNEVLEQLESETG